MDNANFHNFILQKFQQRKKNQQHKPTQNNTSWKQELQEKGYFVVTKKFFADKFGNGEIAVNFHPNTLMSVSSHQHDFFELIYAYRGNVINKVDGKNINLNQGDLCLLNANAVHSLSVVDQGTMIINILISKSVLDRTFVFMLADNDMVFNFFADSLHQKYQNQNYMLFNYQEYCQSDCQLLLHKIIMEYFLKQPSYQKIIEITMISLFIELTRGYSVNLAEKSINKYKNVNMVQIIDYIGKNYKTATLSSTAKYFNYHPHYVPLLLKKFFGKSFSEILQTFRLDRAKDFLKNSNMTIDEVVSEVGYSDKSYFYQIFKENTGVTPAQYRNQGAK